MSRAAQRLKTLRTPWLAAYAVRRRAMLAVLAVAAPARGANSPLGLERVGSDYGGWTIPAAWIQPGWRCLCAGAGVDVSFDLTLAERFGARVVTIDPTEESREHVERVDPDGRLEFVGAALWSHSGELAMFVAADPAHRTLSADDLQRTGRSVTVAARALTDFGPLDLIKLDVEGAEYELLGAVAATGARVVCVEMHPTRGLRAAYRAFRSLVSDGYECVARHGADFTFVRKA